MELFDLKIKKVFILYQKNVFLVFWEMEFSILKLKKVLYFF